MNFLKPINIKATTLPDAWFQTLYRCVELGREFTINEGSFKGQKRLEFDFVTIHITQPSVLPLTPVLNPALNIPDPVEAGYIGDYIPYLMTDVEQEGESYTYGQRMTAAKCGRALNLWNSEYGMEIYKQDSEIWSSLYGDGPKLLKQQNGMPLLNQMELMIWTYKNKGYRNNQMCLQVAQPNDMLLQDPPCLRHIDTRIQDGKLHFFPYFRSWDLFGGFPANLAAIEEMKHYCADEIGVENGEIIATSKGLHIYDYVFEIAEAIRGRSMDEFRSIIE